ncbi:MAG: nitrite/sulfite reductase [Caulobacteraceae bacterium]|nr:nitrite/sulfite reductase [Caulobacter sp.]
MNGLYLQLHAYMLRVAIPYGVLSSRQLHALADIARRFDKGYGHFTTRQNLQFNWIALADAPDAWDALAAADLHAIQTSGNCIRNTTSDPYAGAVAGEADDPRVWSEAIRQWSTLHPEFSWLPRKFKMAVTASEVDRTALRLHDIGLQLRRDDEGRLVFGVSVGGGQGRTPYVGQVIAQALPAERLFSYLSAILRTYNRLGRRDNLFKARIKILVAAMGADAFREAVEAEWNALDPALYDVPAAEIARIRGRFGVIAFEPRPTRSAVLEAAKADDRALARFVRNNLKPHRRPGYAILNIALKAPGEVPGDATADQMDALAALAARCSFDEIRVTHEQNLVLPHVALDDVPAVFAELQRIGLASPNLGLVSDIIACPGLDYCALANTRAIPLAQEIALRFADPARAEAAGALTVNISGCINACAHHHVANIGILGVDKKGEEFFQLTLGGRADAAARVGDALGPALPYAGVAPAVEALVDAYLRERRGAETFVETYARVGLAPFKEAVYADADPA